MKSALVLMVLVAAAMPARAEIDASALMRDVDRGNRPAFEKATMTMEVRTGGEPLTRRLVWHFTNEEARRTSLMKFTAPANVEGSGTLVIEQPGKDNAIWHYQPATRNVRRISSQHRQNRFMGTDFIFEDFEGLKLEKYRFTHLRTDDCGEQRRCEVIEARPTAADEAKTSQYARKHFWVDAERKVIVRTDLFDRNDEHVKTYASTGFRQLAGHWRPSVQEMRTVDGRRSTRLIEVERSVDQAFDPYYVSQQYLRSD